MTNHSTPAPHLKGVSLALLLVTLLIYSPVLGFKFVGFDDGQFVTENPKVLGGVTSEGLRWAFLTSGEDYWRPLSWVSHMVDVELFALNAGGHHLTSLWLHAASALLLFLTLRRMTQALWPSALVAALFAWHPLHVESVAWVAERKDVLCACFWFLTMWAYAVYTEQRSPRRYGLVLLCFTLGLMSKPMIITLPFALLLLDVWPLRRWAWPVGNAPLATSPGRVRSPGLGRLIWEKLPLFALAAVVSAATFVAARKIGTVTAVEHLPLPARAANAAIAYATYLKLTFWPVDLAVMYPLNFHWPASLVTGAAALLAALTWVAVHNARHRPYLLVGWLWFLGTLIPVIGLVQVGAQAWADRYTYLPLIGIFIVIAWGGAEWLAARPQRKMFAVAVSVAALSLCLGLTARQLRSWRDTESLWSHALAVTRGNWFAHSNLSIELLDQGRAAEALLHAQEAVRLRPHRHDTHTRLGNVLFALGRHAEARASYATSYARLGAQEAFAAVSRVAALAQMQPAEPEMHYYLASALLAVGRPAEAIPALQRVVQLQPDYAAAHLDLAALLTAQRRPEDAIRHYREAIRLVPTNDLAHANLGGLLLDAGRPAEAVIHLAEALRLRPDNPATRHNLALTLTRLGRDAEAAAEFRAVLRLQPDNANSLNKLAWLLATSPVDAVRDGAEAARLAEHVRQLAPGQAMAHDTLAAAYAAIGRFADAVAAAQRAVALAQAAGQTKPAAEYQSRLDLYQNRQAYRTPPVQAAPP